MLLLTELLLKAFYNSIITNILSLQESDQIFLVFQYYCPNKVFLNNKYAMKGFIKTLPCMGLLLPFLNYWIWWYLPNGHLNSPKIRQTYFWSLLCDVVFGNFLHSELFNWEIIAPALRIYLFFVLKSKHQKVANLTLGLICFKMCVHLFVNKKKSPVVLLSTFYQCEGFLFK